MKSSPRKFLESPQGSPSNMRHYSYGTVKKKYCGLNLLLPRVELHGVCRWSCSRGCQCDGFEVVKSVRCNQSVEMPTYLAGVAERYRGSVWCNFASAVLYQLAWCNIALAVTVVIRCGWSAYGLPKSGTGFILMRRHSLPKWPHSPNRVTSCACTKMPDWRG